MKLTIIMAYLAISTIFFVDGFGQKQFAAGAPVDLVFKLKSKPAKSPFDVSFGAVFTSPEKKTLTVPGFYNDNQEYVMKLK